MTFYKHFPSKEILIEDCLSATSERFKIEITKEINKIEKDDYLKKVKAIYTCYVQCFKSESFNGCIFQKAIYEILILYPSVITPIKNYKTWLFQTISYLLVQLNISQPQFLSSIIINISDGIISYEKVDQENIQMESLWNYIENLINYNRQKN